MQLEKYIHVESEAIPLDFCDEIIKEYDDDEYERGTINDYETSKYRQCDVIILSDKKIIQRNNKSRNNIDKKIYNIINKNIDKYLQDYATLNFNLKEDTGYQLLRYNIGDYVTEHIDTSSGEHRTLSCTLALIDESLVNAKLAELKAIQAYQSKRVAEYPPLEEQLDKIYHSGIDAWKADIKAIKDKYPKPS